MLNPTAPCKNCLKRELGCHSNCDAYKEFKINLSEYNKETRANKTKFLQADAFAIEQCIRGGKSTNLRKFSTAYK